MELRGVSWCVSVAVALVCGVRWPPVHATAGGPLAPGNEVPLRPSVGLEEGRVTSVALPKGRTRREHQKECAGDLVEAPRQRGQNLQLHG
ncbi:hypothetical protein CRUP_017932 [Coryphaenoides rupestris]|nr:hypothetical protein CRUP_017932 [Coryphaenoides rupestris]